MRFSAHIPAILLLVAFGGCAETKSEALLPSSTSFVTPPPKIKPSIAILYDCSDRLFFESNSAKLTINAKNSLERCWLPALKSNSDSVVLFGHSDARGSREFNLALGLARAEVVRDYLIAHGIPPDRMKAFSYGKERPAVKGSNEEAWALNRRVEIQAK